jgi:hypothetical protein
MSAGAIDPKQVLGDISGGRVLDVATGTGGFVRCLLDGLGRARVVFPRPIGLADCSFSCI